MGTSTSMARNAIRLLIGGIAREASSKFQTSMEGEGSKVGNEKETLGSTTGPWLFPRLRQLRRRRSRGWKKEQAYSTVL
jgi:hypothetical protein